MYGNVLLAPKENVQQSPLKVAAIPAAPRFSKHSYRYGRSRWIPRTRCNLRQCLPRHSVDSSGPAGSSNGCPQKRPAGGTHRFIGGTDVINDW